MGPAYVQVRYSAQRLLTMCQLQEKVEAMNDA